MDPFLQAKAYRSCLLTLALWGTKIKSSFAIPRPDQETRTKQMSSPAGIAVLLSRIMTQYSVTQLGPMDSWRDCVGGFRPDTTRAGRRVVDHEITSQIIGMTANSYEPGEQAGYWHTHSVLEEVYVFLHGEGQMGLDGDIVDVHPGTVVMVPPGVLRTWRCVPESSTNLTWLCIRAGQNPLPAVPDDAEPLRDIPLPW